MTMAVPVETIILTKQELGNILVLYAHNFCRGEGYPDNYTIYRFPDDQIKEFVESCKSDLIDSVQREIEAGISALQSEAKSLTEKLSAHRCELIKSLDDLADDILADLESPSKH
jgi:hypothetical protein